MTNSHNYLFVSDFHVGTGRVPSTGLYSRQEDFFQDLPIARFLYYHADHQVRISQADPDSIHNKPWKLIINGDLFEFMEVTSKPAEGQDLYEVRGVRRYRDLPGNERRFGLGTRPGECKWKLELIARGHPLLFQALAWFLAHDGYAVVLLIGNHDIELHWEKVQQAFREILVAAYDDWRAGMPGQETEPHPLPPHTALLEPEQFITKVHSPALIFPPSFWYEADLFYAEHGGQYDHTTGIPSYENPVLSTDPAKPEKSDLIQLPSGPLFVRYAFNKAERIHPFAENIKPVPLRYFLWLTRERPKSWLKVLSTGPEALLQISWKRFKDFLRRFTGSAPESNIDPAANGCADQPGGEYFCADLIGIQKTARKRLKRRAGAAVLINALILVIGLGVLILLILAFKGFISGERVLWICARLAIAVLLWLIKSLLSGMVDGVLESPFIFEAAEKIFRLMGDPDRGLAPVPYFIFGHNHRATVRRLDEPGREGGGEQPTWYVNTGSWLPEFHEADPFREDYCLTFLRLVPGRPGFGTDVPELMQWSAESDRPYRARLLREESI